jgi:amino-acid N-acetyltransferase
MSTDQLVLESVTADTHGFLEECLVANDLPTADVASNLDWFYVGYVDGEPIGVGGIEPNGSVGLLRSVVVTSSVRGRGYGGALTDALEARARRDGIETLYLLTTTADQFFEARGYTKLERAEAPRSIQRTSEFESLCPESATCMKKSL